MLSEYEIGSSYEIGPSYEIGLSALLEQDLSSYEYFHSLPESVQRRIEKRDIGSFDEMQSYVKSLRDNGELR